MVVASQSVFWSEQGAVDRRLNPEVMQGPDFDGDGFLDMWNVTQRALLGGGGWDFDLISGRTGHALIRQFTPDAALGFASPSQYGPAGDFDGDGFPDWWWRLSVGSVRQAALQVRSGRDGSMLLGLTGQGYGQRFGYRVLGGVDVDGDGRPELVVSDIDRVAPATGSVHVFRRDGSLAYTIDSPPRWQWGTALAKVGDVDRDGGDDFAMAAPEASGRGSAILVSGRTGKVLQVGYGELAGDRMDFSVTGCGDMDCDGFPDFAGGGFWGIRGVARVFSGRTGAVIHSWVGPYNGAYVGAYFGSMLLGNIDVDQDGVPDLVTNTYSELRAGQCLCDTIYAMSGRDGRIILEHADSNLKVFSGLNLVSVSGPGRPAIGLSVQRHGIPNQEYGRHEMIDLRPWGTTLFGQGCTTVGGPTIRLGISRDRDQHTRIMASDVEADAPCVLLLGRSNTVWQGRPLPLDLSPHSWPGCQLGTSIEVTVPAIAGRSWPRTGLATVDLPWPLAAGNAPPLHLQWLSFTSNGVRMSSAATVLLRLR